MFPEKLPKNCGKEGFCQQVCAAGFAAQDGDSSCSCDAGLMGQLSIVSRNSESTAREKDGEVAGHVWLFSAVNNFWGCLFSSVLHMS